MSNYPIASIAGRRVAVDEPPYLFAERSANRNGKPDTALAIAIVQAAKAAGADAVKLQTYLPDTITLNPNSANFQNRGGLWNGGTLYELYEQTRMQWEWLAPLFEHAPKPGITVFRSPIDSTAVNLQEDLNAPSYKIATFEAVDLPLISVWRSPAYP